MSGVPISGMPVSGMAGEPGTALVATNDPFDDPLSSSYPRRITPTPKAQRSRLTAGLLIGLLTGLVVFGAGGFFTGRYTAPQEGGATVTTTASASPDLGTYEQSQVALNRSKFSGNLVTFAQPWLPYLSGCNTNSDRSGPKLNSGEAARVVCNFGGATTYFIEYKSIGDRDKARTSMLAQNIDARTLTPGALEPTQNRDGLKGNYVEYAYKAGDPARIVAGIWWDLADQPVSGYLVAYWTDGLGSSWEPLRDLWHRHH